MRIVKAHINGSDIYHAFISGAKRIISDKVNLNRINVFPVPDGDTGTNLAVTMDHIISTAKCDESVDRTMESIYDASLRGARGNSGMIFASFISGLKKYVSGRSTLTMPEFSEAIESSVETAYEAVANPVEGTMLTVLKDWARSIREHVPRAHHFGELIEKSLADARVSLAATRLKLEVLRKANVVDSGGRGIVDFIEGILEFFRMGSAQENSLTGATEVPENLAVVFEGERYCTEMLIDAKAPDVDRISETLCSLGSSVVVNAGDGIVRIHVHTDSPDRVVAFAKSIGNIKQQKIDDMRRQTEMNSDTKRIALVTDSIADIPQELTDKYGIYVVPVSVFIDGTEYFDKFTVTPDTFYDMADKAQVFPTSSQPPVSKFDELFSLLSGKYDSIIGFFVASALSGTYQNAAKAAAKIAENGYRIDVIDSKLNSGAQGLVLSKMAEMLYTGRKHDEILTYALETIKKTKIYVSVINFIYMVRGGRVSPLKGFAAKLMNVKPVVSLDENGKGIAFGKAFSVKQVEAKILGLLKDAHDKKRISAYSIVYSRDIKRAERLAAEAEKITGIKPAYITEISSVVGISAGRGAAAISFITERE